MRKKINLDNLPIVISFFALIVAGGSTFFMWKTFQLQKEINSSQLRSTRSYVSISAQDDQVPTIKYQEIDKCYMFTYSLRNIGKNPIVELTGKLFMMPTDFSSEPTTDEFTTANDIGPNDAIWKSCRFDGISDNTNPAFIIIILEYKDPILLELFYQEFFLKFLGVSNRIWYDKPRNATSEEKAEIKSRYPDLFN